LKLSETVTQENTPEVLTYEVATQTKELNAEAVTAMAAGFLRRIGHKGPLKPKRVSAEENLYTVEIELKKFTATIKVDTEKRQLKEFDVQPKREESSGSFSPKSLLMNFATGGIISVGIYFCFKLMGV